MWSGSAMLSDGSSNDLHLFCEEEEIGMIEEALRRHRGNVVHTAEEVRMARSSLYERFRKYAIDPRKFARSWVERGGTEHR